MGEPWQKILLSGGGLHAQFNEQQPIKLVLSVGFSLFRQVHFSTCQVY